MIHFIHINFFCLPEYTKVPEDWSRLIFYSMWFAYGMFHERVLQQYMENIFLYNFSFAIMLEMFCYLKLNIFAEWKCGKNLRHQHQVIFKI